MPAMDWLGALDFFSIRWSPVLRQLLEWALPGLIIGLAGAGWFFTGVALMLPGKKALPDQYPGHGQ